MRFLRRATLIGLALTLLLFVSSCFWICSFRRGGLGGVELSGGRLHVFTFSPNTKPPVQGLRISRRRSPIDLRIDAHVYSTWWFVRVPLWIPAGFFILAGAWPWFQRFTCPRGHCTRCRYALTGLHADREGVIICPECGRRNAIERSAKTNDSLQGG